MPALANVPGCFKYSLLWTVAGDTNVSSRLFFAYTGTPPTPAQCITAAGASNAAINTNFAPLMHPNVISRGTRITDLTSPSSADATNTQATAGTRNSAFLSGATAAMVNFKISRRYRGGKPRVYFPFGVSADLTDQDDWAAAFVTSVNNALTAYINAVIASPPGTTTITGQVNVAYYHGFSSYQNPVTKRWHNSPTPVPGPITPDPIVSRALNVKPGNQRRRVRPG